ncbi:hypothetical protein JNK13_01210 [bacterium]|nr:hypothetical protein [bacterium]
MRHQLFIVFFFMIATSACDIYYGVSRHTIIEQPTSYECVLSAIRAVSGIVEAELRTVEGGRRLTLTGLQKPKLLHYFIYKTDSFQHSLLIAEEFDGTLEYRHGYQQINKKPSQVEVDNAMNVIKAIDASVEKRCGIKALSNLTNVCNGVKC